MVKYSSFVRPKWISFSIFFLLKLKLSLQHYVNFKYPYFKIQEKNKDIWIMGTMIAIQWKREHWHLQWSSIDFIISIYKITVLAEKNIFSRHKHLRISFWSAHLLRILWIITIPYFRCWYLKWLSNHKIYCDFIYIYIMFIIAIYPSMSIVLLLFLLFQFKLHFKDDAIRLSDFNVNCAFAHSLRSCIHLTMRWITDRWHITNTLRQEKMWRSSHLNSLLFDRKSTWFFTWYKFYQW